MALVIGGEGMAAESVLSSYPTKSVDPDVFARWVILRAANLVWMLARPIEAAELLTSVLDTATSPTAHAEAAVVKACILAVKARPADAVHEAEKAMAPGTLSDFYALMATAAIVMSSGSIGDIDKADQYARRGYERAASSWQTAHLQFWLAAIHARACRVAGRIEHCREEAARFSELACDVPTLTHVQAVFLRGHSELAAGHLQSAITLLLDSLVGNSSHPSVSTGLNPAGLIWLGEARAVGGDTVAAKRTIELFDSVRPTEYAFMESGASLAAAWCAAAEGNVDEAVRLAMRTADIACTRGQFAYEVVALQTATQLGYTGAADRLSALTAMVHGPRVAVAARHASALRDANGAELLVASELFESFGDLVAAAHAAAQAGAAFAADEQRSSSLLAFETARRIARECGCVPVLSVQDAKPVQFTDRQREIVGLVAEGLSNRDIADRLTMSVRSVEGHLYRAAQRAGVSTRGELASIQLGSHRPLSQPGATPSNGVVNYSTRAHRTRQH
jgi:DNA-binding CsgD family transcriptional regulator